MNGIVSEIRGFLNLIERKIDAGIPKAEVEPKINPALLTFDEYRDLVDDKHQEHDDDTFQFTLSELNDSDADVGLYPHLIKNFRTKGENFKIKGRREKLRYLKYTPSGDPMKVNGQPVYYRDDEIKASGWNLYRWDLAVFNEKDQRVASVQDEYGSLLIVVAEEYKGFGFGPMLVKIARTIYPDRASGGFTPGGFKNFQKVYREFVRDALKSGLYTKLVKQGDLSMDRVKEIIASARGDFRQLGEE